MRRRVPRAKPARLRDLLRFAESSLPWVLGQALIDESAALTAREDMAAGVQLRGAPATAPTISGILGAQEPGTGASRRWLSPFRYPPSYIGLGRMMADKRPLAPLTLDHRDRRTQRLMKSPRGGPPMTLGNAAGARVRLIV
jgi:hypothetical protein